MAFWDLVFYTGDYEGVRNMTNDKFWEAYMAYQKIADEKGGGSSAF